MPDLTVFFIAGEDFDGCPDVIMLDGVQIPKVRSIEVNSTDADVPSTVTITFIPDKITVSTKDPRRG